MYTEDSDIIDSLIKDMKRFMDSYYYPYDMWFVGIADRPKDHLASKHRVKVDCDPWTFIRAPSPEVARTVQRHFIEILGSDGSQNNGGAEGVEVYAYKKNMHTRP